jgi:hypothetical protein
MRKSISFINGNSVGDTITGIENDTSSTTRGIEGEDSLNCDVHGGGVESFKHDLSHLFSVGLGIEWSFGKEDWVFLRSNSKFVVEGVMPDLLHVIPVGDNTMFNGVLEGQDTSLGLSLISDIGIFLSHTNHDTLMSGSSNDGGENGSRGIVSGKTSLAHTGSIVDNKSGHVVVTHFDWKEVVTLKHDR